MFFDFFKKHAHQNNYKSPIAVILIDMQVDFVDDIRQNEKTSLIQNQISIINFCINKDIPLIVLEYAGHEKTIDKLSAKIKQVPRVKKITKHADDGFSEKKLLSYLKQIGAQTLLMMGINADYCVKATSKSAVKNNFAIITSNSLLSGMPHHSSDNSINWYGSNGTLYKNIDDIIVQIV